MQSGQHGKHVKGAFEHAFDAVRAELVAEHPECALSQLRAIEQKGLFPAERQWEMHELMGQILLRLSDLKAALPHLKLVWQLPCPTPWMRLTALSNYLMDLHYVDGLSDEDLYAEHRMYGTMIGDLSQFSHAKRRREKLRIGYLTPSLTDHIVLNFAIQLFAAYDRSCFEVYLYDLGRQQSDVMEWVAGMTDHYHCFAQAAAEDAARRIYADGIDILFDLAGHSAGGKTLQIAAYKPAPVQISGIGYFNTTGLPTMDYVLGDPIVDPPSMDGLFTERILRLPYTHLCFTPSERFRDYENLHRIPHDPPVFGSFNNFSKITDEILRLWGEILAAVPCARLLLKNVHPSREALCRMRTRAKRAGIDMERLDLRPGTREYLRDYLEVDIILDTYPYQGGGTTCEALFMGLPVVTMAGTRHGARFGAGLLHNVGLAELVTEDSAAYTACAVGLASDRELLTALHTAIPHMMRASPLMDGRGYVRAVEAAYKMIWERYLNEEA